MACLRSKYQPFCFASPYLFFLFSSSFFWTVGPPDLANGYRYSQNINESSVGRAGDKESLSCFAKCCFLFQLFHVEWKTHAVSFLENRLTNSRLFAVCDQGTRVLQKSGINGGCLTTLIPFPMGNVSPGNIQIHWIYITPFNRFASGFHQNDHTVSVHLVLVTDDLENVGQAQNLQKF